MADESSFRSELKMTKFEEVYLAKTETVRSLQVKLNQEVSYKSKVLQDSALKRNVSKLSISITLQEHDEDENEENVKNAGELKDDVYDDDDVCDSMAKIVSSSYNSPDVNKHDRGKT